MNGAERNHQLTWPVSSLSAVESTAGGSWLVVADDSMGMRIGRTLGPDCKAALLPPSVLGEDADSTVLSGVLGSVSDVLYAPDLSSIDFDVEAGCALFGAVSRLATALAAAAPPPKLYLLPGNARRGVGDGRENPADAVLWGLGCALAVQLPETWGGMVELADEGRDFTAHPAANNGDGAVVPAGDIKEMWRRCEPERRRKLLNDHVGVLVAAVMGLPSPQALDPSADFFELGMDSLMSVILLRALATTLDEELAQAVVFDHPTVAALADYLAKLPTAQQRCETDEQLVEVALSRRLG